MASRSPETEERSEQLFSRVQSGLTQCRVPSAKKPETNSQEDEDTKVFETPGELYLEEELAKVIEDDDVEGEVMCAQVNSINVDIGPVVGFPDI